MNPSLVRFLITVGIACCTVLYCTVLHCAVLCCMYCAVLSCPVLCCPVPSCAVLCCTVLCCAVLCCGTLCCAVLYCTVLCCAVVYCAVLCCAVLYCTVPGPVASDICVSAGVEVLIHLGSGAPGDGSVCAALKQSGRIHAWYLLRAFVSPCAPRLLQLRLHLRPRPGLLFTPDLSP